MKNFTKILICLILCAFAFGLSACGTKSLIHPDLDAEVYSNGGLAVKKGNYLYFVNGYMSANDMTVRDASYTNGGIYVVKLDSDGNPTFSENGELDSNNYAAVSKKLSGFEATDLHIFGNYLYFTSPCQENQNKTWAKGLVLFYRVELQTGKTTKIYQTSSSILSEEDSKKPEYAYYYDGTTTYLLVYEKADSQLVVINTSNKSKTTIDNVNNTVMPKNGSSQILYVKNADDDGLYSICKMDLASRQEQELGKKDKAITVKFITNEYFFFEISTENVDDSYLYYLPTSATSIEGASACWTSVKLMSNYYLTEDGNTIIGIRDNVVQYKYNWQQTALNNVSSFNAETETINLIGATDTNFVYYCKGEDENKIVIKTVAYGASQAKTVAEIENANTTYFDLNEDYLYFYKTIGNHQYLHRLQISNNDNTLSDQFIGIYLEEDIPEEAEE